MTIPRNLAIPSSGDPERDAAELERVYLHESRMAANICPNGCGAMVWDDPQNRHCPVCNFHGWSNCPHTEGEA